MDDMVKKAADTITVLFRVSPQIKRALDKAAADDQRTLASYMRKITTERLEADGYLK
jgi:uncharacterized protein (DUF1778 family)